MDNKGKKYSVSDITKAVASGRQIVLLGEFGTGKSRCVQETFHQLSLADELFSPMAINLRDNWGIKKMSGIVRGHLEDLGMEEYAGSVLKSVRSGNHPVLLDGFDEIGSQSWSGEASRLEYIRRASLQGVRDLIENLSGAGLLITGREHYFSSEVEMLMCLGLNSNTCTILRCPEEFTREEAKAYLSRTSSNATLPDWLPRKPLVCQLLAKLDVADLKLLDDQANGEVEFFESVLDAICKRETRIHAALDSETIKRILLHLAQESRLQTDSAESLTPEQINNAFYQVTGTTPIDESAVLLQRLPYLGRVGSGGSDRIFIDEYAKNGLRGLATHIAISTADKDVLAQRWRQPLNDFGLRTLAHKVPSDNSALKYLKQCTNYGNHQIAADYVAAKVLAHNVCDFENLIVDDASIVELNFSSSTVSRLTLLNIDFRLLVIEDSAFNEVFIDDCIIEVVDGVSARNELPEMFGHNCVVSDYRYALTTASISGLNLSNSQKTLLALLKKLFFQRGSGRKEEALLRGAEAYWDSGAAEEAIAFMLREGIVTKRKGDSGWVYSPQRKHTKRMNLIVEKQKQSGDVLWDLVS
ncbi:hypothetical protein LJ753_01395 [Arthrobacter sp. zg-Y20]|uniref:hypothetical protein n=1 Tax=unclassified Arthrobacter TaxID=235627 RepID=UPI001D155974|nr:MULTISPECIES: hypothetical protein [unclassified Arthrobacter]MCC3274524.1 hypothetical protein [Arthrobacter sp. zg-Y20]MDK1314681.1 hypothetical protein [Arthrobacter sp. zg.Y20]WIB07661.1 hypothetical protein QNO06_08145 [Arthrobacter sp. zg-Y20]